MSSHHGAYNGSGQPYYQHPYPYPPPSHSASHSPIPPSSPFQYPFPLSPTNSHGIPSHAHMPMNGHQPPPPRINNTHPRPAYPYPQQPYASRSHPNQPFTQNYPNHPQNSKYPPYHQHYYPPQVPYPHPPPHWQPPQISHSPISISSPKPPAFSTTNVSQQSDTPSPDSVAQPKPIESSDQTIPPAPSPSPPSPPPETPSQPDEPAQMDSPLQFLSSADASIPGGYTVWSRRPRRPSQAPGIIISSRARPPPDVVKKALTLSTPPASPQPSPSPLPSPHPAETSIELPHTPEIPSKKRVIPSEYDSPIQVAPLADSFPSSSTATDVTNTPSPTTTPGSPVSTTNTSVSVNVTTLQSKEPESDAIPPQTTPIVEKEAVTPTPISQPKEEMPVQIPTPTTPPAKSTPPPPPQKKSWASLLQPSPSSTKQKNSLPTSHVVGVSIPAAEPSRPPTSERSVDPAKKTDLLRLLSPNAGTSNQIAATTHSYASATTSVSSVSAPPVIRPRGLVNTGNMCFANSVLQALVYCPPFHKLFLELGRVLGDAGGTGLLASVHSEGDSAVVKETALVDATIRFLKEFGAKTSEVEASTRKGKGKEKEVVVEDEWDGEFFIPSYVYDALKENKRFDHMRGGQQEDAEEFLGFYLDTLEEELLSILNAISPPTSSRLNVKVEEHEEEAPPEDDGWLEVGKRNRSVITRTIKTVESAMTRIFGGKFRTTLRAPSQKDSVIVEDWRSLRLDIHPDQIHTVQDALSHISQPQTVQVTQRPGVTVDASQLVLIESLPPVLVLHMKRFCYDTDVKGVVKVGKHIAFGPELEVKSDIMVTKRPPVTKYKLFGVVYHHGLSASGGHYTLDVLHPNRYPSSIPGSSPREAWIRIDDEFISDIRPDDVFSPSADETRCAYLLLYRRLGK